MTRRGYEAPVLVGTLQALAGGTVRVDDAALEVLREHGAKHCWYGIPDIVMEISERAGCKQGHPLNKSAAVIGAVARSKKFKCTGFIRHLGRRYNVYEPV